MSRLAKQPIKIPEGVLVAEKDTAMHVKGPKGELEVPLLRHVSVTKETREDMGDVFRVEAKKSTNEARANAGTVWSLLRNAILGVTEGFAKTLEVEGVGYRVELSGETLALSVGFTEQVRITPPKGISLQVEKNVITVSGVDKAQVGKIAAEIREVRPPEPYKGKGIRYQGEVIRRKVGKKAGAVAE